MSYSDDEKQSALLEFERSDVLSGGQKARALEMVSAVLVREPDALFTIVMLTVKKLLRSLSAVDELLVELLEHVDAIIRKRHSLDDSTALQEVSNLVSSVQSSALLSGTVPKVKSRRLTTAINGAVSYLSTNMRGAVLYESKDAALRSAAQKKKTVVADIEAVLVLVDNVVNALVNFRRSGLDGAVALARLGRVADGITDTVDGYEAMSLYQRALTAKATVLRLLAADTAFQEVLVASTSGQPRLLQKPSLSPTYKVVATGTGSYPVLLGDVSAPWPLESGSSTLGITLNGTSVSVDVLSGGSGITAAALVGDKTETFGISDDIATPPALQSAAGTYNIASGSTDMLTINVDNKTYRIQLTAGAAQTPAQVANDINTDPAVTADTRITASAVGGRVQIDYSNPSPPSEYGSRFMEVATGPNDATALRSWRSSTTGNPAGTRSIGWTANNKLRVQANDDPDYVEVTLPSGDWPDYQVSLGDTLTADTIVYAIDQAAQAANEDFSAEASSSKLRIFSTIEGEGSIVTIRTAGLSSASGRCARTLGFSQDQEERAEDITSSSVAAALNEDTDFSAEAVAAVDKEILLAGLVEVASSTEITFVALVTPEPTFLTATPSPKIALSLPESDGVYGVLSYSWVFDVLTVTLDRRLRDGVGVRGQASVYTEQLKITSFLSDSTANIQCTSGPTTVLGLSTSEVTSTLGQVKVQHNDPVVGWKNADLFGLNITVGDKLLEYGGEEISEVTAVDVTNAILTISPNVTVSFERSVDGFSLHSGSAVSYESLISRIGLWQLDEDATALVTSMQKTLSRLFAVPTRDAAVQAKSAISAVQSHLSSLSSILSEYAPLEISVILVALQGLAEGGQDNARELLVSSDYIGFGAVAGKTTGMDSLRQAAGAFYTKDVGSERHGRRTAMKAVWVDATDPSNVFDDLELEGEDEFYTPNAWGDEEI